MKDFELRYRDAKIFDFRMVSDTAFERITNT